jgi:regulator of nucleoside diphosphate kinase
MMAQKALITAYDFPRLAGFAANVSNRRTSENAYLSEKLQELLERAEIIRPWHISSDVVTMNSKVRLRDCRKNEDMLLRLVFPKDAGIDDINVSILTPLGLAILGRKVGDVISDRIKVEEVLFQPEAEGRFEL